MSNLPPRLDAVELVTVPGDIRTARPDQAVPADPGKRMFRVRIDQRHVMCVCLELEVKDKHGRAWERQPSDEEVIRGLRAAAIAAGLIDGDPTDEAPVEQMDTNQRHWLDRWEADHE